MEIGLSTWMMIFFIISLVASIWKIYAFLPNEALSDDDKTEESQEELLSIILRTIKNGSKVLTLKELFEEIKKDDEFDENHYWRFNQNRLNQLLSSYYLKNEKINSISDIYNS